MRTCESVASLKTWILSVRLILASDHSPDQQISSTRRTTGYESCARPLNILVKASRCCSRNIVFTDEGVEGSMKDSTRRM